MTVQTSTNKVAARGNGATTIFNFPFQLPDASGATLRVTFIDAAGRTTVLATGLYTVQVNTPDGSGRYIGGSVTYPLFGSPIATGTILLIERIVPLTQLTALGGQSGFFPEVVEAALDNLEYQIQQLFAGISLAPLALTFPVTDVAPVTVLPPAAQRAGLYLGFDAQGNPVAIPGVASVGPDLSAYTSVASGGNTALNFAQRASLFLSVTDFGAKGDGVTDETAAIQAAVNGAARKSLFFPPGNYKITSQVNILTTVHLWAKPFSATIYMATANVNGFVIGDGTTGTRANVPSTYIDGLQFAVLPGSSVSSSGACVAASRANNFVIKNCSFAGSDAGTHKLCNAISVDRCLEWSIERCLVSGFAGNGVFMQGAGTAADFVSDGRIDFCEFTQITADAIYIGDYTAAISITKPVIYSCSAYAIHINCTAAAGVGFNYFVSEPDIEVTTGTGALGGIYVQKGGTTQIAGGWIGGANGIKVDSTGSSVTAIGVQLAASGAAVTPVVIAGPACSLIGCDVVGDATTTQTGIAISGIANDTNITGGRIRQWITAGVAYSGTPARCIVQGVQFTSNSAANVTGDGISSANAPSCRNCRDDGTTFLVAAATLPVRHGQDFVQATGATAITAIAPIGLNSRLTIQAGAGGIQINNGAGINLKGGVNATVPAFATIDLICTGLNWQETGRSF